MSLDPEISLSPRNAYASNDGIVSSASGAEGPARGGSVSITAGQVDLTNNAFVSARNLGGGDAGDLTVTANRTVRIDASTVTTTAEQGASGNLTITAGTDVELTNGGLVTAETSGPGDTGDIRIVATNNISLDNSTVSTQAVLADGGNIKLGAEDIVLLTDSTISSSVGTGEGGGGNITIDPVFVILKNSLIQANAFGGPGGNILIVTNFFIADPSSVVEASSVKDIAGNVVITAPDTDVTGALAVLPSEYVDAASRLAADCSARGSQAPASLVGEGRGGLPVPPGGPRVSYYSLPSAEAMSPGDTASRALPGLWIAKQVANSNDAGTMLKFIPVTLAGECKG